MRSFGFPTILAICFPMLLLPGGCKSSTTDITPSKATPHHPPASATKQQLSDAQRQLLETSSFDAVGVEDKSIAVTAAALDNADSINGIQASSPSIRIVTWNAKAVFSVEDVVRRRAFFETAGRQLHPDVLVIQEVASESVAKAIARAMGLQNFHVACSDFNQDDLPDYANLEVAILSRFPLDQVIEYDQSPDNVAGDVSESLLEAPVMAGLATADMPRGYLWARIDSVGLTISTTHLKSARGKSGVEDYESSQKREFIAAAMAAGVNEDRKLYPTYACVVAGDLNVAHADQVKNGVDLMSDRPENPDASDGYDETHALFGAGLVDGLRMRNLCLDIRTSSNPSFPQNSPIDNIYIYSVGMEEIEPAWLSTDLFGSDHLPVVADVNVRE